MLLVADVIDSKKINMTDEKKLFGIDKLNIKVRYPAVTHVTILLEYKLYIKRLIQCTSH